jgi:hypothetical protein
MAQLQRQYKKKIGGVTFKSGGIYKFDYSNWQHDPRPVIIFMYAYRGYHPNTGREWRFIQGINFTYVPRAFRRLFATIWISKYGAATTFKRGQLDFTWDMVLRSYRYLRPALRRYFYTPNYYMTNIEEVPFENWEKEIMSTMSKDFSKKVRGALKQKFKSALGGFKSIRRLFGRRI